jgi:hypothetical protein
MSETLGQQAAEKIRKMPNRFACNEPSCLLCKETEADVAQIIDALDAQRTGASAEEIPKAREGWFVEHPTSGKPVEVVTREDYDWLYNYAAKLQTGAGAGTEKFVWSTSDSRHFDSQEEAQNHQDNIDPERGIQGHFLQAGAGTEEEIARELATIAADSLLGPSRPPARSQIISSLSKLILAALRRSRALPNAKQG